MELRTLKYFITVAQQESFSRAAESLFVTQSSLSKQIASLEKELGITLFERHGRSITLSPAGEVLLEGAIRLVEEEQELSSYVSKVGEKMPQYNKLILQLRDPVPENIDFCKILAKTVLEFKALYPSIRFEFRYDNNPAPIMNLSSAEADLFVCMANEVRMDDDLNIMVLTEDPFVLVASDRLIPDPSNVDYVNILSNYPIVIGNEGNAVLDVSQVLNEFGLHPRIEYTNGIFAQLMALCAQDCVSLIPQNSVHRIMTQGLSVAQLPPEMSRVSLFLLYRKNIENPLVPLFVNSLKEKMSI